MHSRLKASARLGTLAAAWLLKGIMVEAAGTNGTAGESVLQAIGGVPTFKLRTTTAELSDQRTEVRTLLRKALGELPPRPDPSKVKIVSRVDRGEWFEERIEFDNGAGSRVPGVFLLPRKVIGKVPAILYCHWHGGEYDGGKIEIFQRKHTPVEPGPALVRRGYAVLAIDAPCFGERHGQGPDGERGSAGEMSAAKLELWLGRSLWGMMLRDDLIALEYLCSRPEIDSDRIGATGISMGATRTWWLMAIDEHLRIRSGVAIACLTRYQDLITAGGLKYHGIYYFVPGLLRHFDTEAVIACVAPRSLLCLNGDQDAGSPPSGIRTIEQLVKPAWEISGRPAEFRSVIYPGVGHTYTPEMWTEMLAWFDRTLEPEK